MKANLILEGEIHTGKTTSLRTLLSTYHDEQGREHRGAGLDTYIVALDPGIAASLGPNLCTEGSGAHWHYLPPPPASPEAAAKWAHLGNTMDADKLSKISDPNKYQFTQFLSLYKLFNADFECHGCHKSFGPLFRLSEAAAVAIDGLTGLTRAATQNFIGSRPLKSLPEIYLIQTAIQDFLDAFWKCSEFTAILITHLEKEANPLSGLSYTTMDTLGQKLAAKLEKIPDDIIVASREGAKFTWDTLERNMLLKSRHLPMANNLAADFSQIFHQPNH